MESDSSIEGLAPYGSDELPANDSRFSTDENAEKKWRWEIKTNLVIQLH